jgi:indoleamine 2,3-dioxygenase
MIPIMLSAMDSALANDTLKVSEALCALTNRLRELEALLERMYEKCDAHIFYGKIRPLLAGSKKMSAAGLPRGVFYNEGDGRGKWWQLNGPSNAQSSLIPFFDIVLGVEHNSARESMPAAESSFMQVSQFYYTKGTVDQAEHHSDHAA